MSRNARLRVPWWIGIVSAVALATLAGASPARADGDPFGRPPLLPQPHSPSPNPRSVVPAAVLGALAAVGIGSGIGFLAVSASNHSAAVPLQAYITKPINIPPGHGTCLNAPSNPGDGYCTQLQRDNSASRTFGDAAIGSFIAGGTAAAATALYVFWPPAMAPASKRMVPSLVLGVLAAVEIGSGVGFQVVSSANHSAIGPLGALLTANYGSCNPNWLSYGYFLCPQLQGEINTWIAYRDAAIGSFIAGGALAVASAGLGIWASRSPNPPPVQVAPVVGSGRAMLVIGGAW